MITNAEPFGISDKLPVTSDVLVRAREALGSIDPNEWPFSTPGIGPTTRFIAAALARLVADLADEVEKLRGCVCAICGGAGSVGYPPDGYFPCECSRERGGETERDFVAEAAAREALASIRDLHKPDGNYGYQTQCESCGLMWPCPTAPLIYTTEELA